MKIPAVKRNRWGVVCQIVEGSLGEGPSKLAQPDHAAIAGSDQCPVNSKALPEQGPAGLA
jgi:hypothetical protein